MLTTIIGTIDVRVEKIHHMVRAACEANDPELAVGGATTQDMSSVQRCIDAAAAACETLDANVRTLMGRR